MKILKKAFVYVLNWKYLIKHGSDTPSFNEILNVNPEEILLRLDQKTKIKKISRIRRMSGCVVNGDWDLHADNKSFQYKQKAIAERYEEGKSWTETGIYEHKLNKLDEVTESSIVELEERYENLDEVYFDIRRAGTLSSREDHLISVCIGRHGQLIHVGQGAHRLAIAKLLGLPKIPVRVGVVHPDGILHLKEYRAM